MRAVAVHESHVRCVAYSPDGKLLATASNDRSVRVRDIAAGLEVRSWLALGGVMQAVAFSPDGKWLAFGGQADRIYLNEWDVSPFPESVPLPSLPLATGVTSLAFLPGGKSLLCGIGDRMSGRRGHVAILDVGALGFRATAPVTCGVQHLALSPDGNEVALGTGRGWEFIDPTGRKLKGGGSVGTSSPAVAYSAGGAYFAAACGYGIRLHRGQEKALLWHLRGHRSKVASLAFTPDGATLVSGSWDRTVRLWDVATGREKCALDWERGKVQYVAMAPDGMTAAAACDRGLVIWDLDL